MTETLNQLKESGDFVVFGSKNFNLFSARQYSYKYAADRGLKFKIEVDNNSVTVTRL